jgi:hypothetical protein
MLLELALSAALLGALTIVSLQMLAALSAQRRAAEQRAVATQEAANLVERVSALPWSEVTPQRVAEMRMSPAAQETLEGATLTLSATEEDGPPAAKHVRVEIDWDGAGPRVNPPVQLHTWLYEAAREGAR